MSNRYLRFTVNVPDYFTSEQRRAVGDKVVSHIESRTTKSGRFGKGEGGKAFAPYSDSYKNSLEFKVAGKSANNVNLTLTGDMLADLDMIGEGIGFVDVGYEDGYYAAEKVEGNVLGSYGGEPNPNKARDFLWIGKDELQKIIDEVDTPGFVANVKDTLSLDEQARAIMRNLEENE